MMIEEVDPLTFGQRLEEPVGLPLRIQEIKLFSAVAIDVRRGQPDRWAIGIGQFGPGRVAERSVQPTQQPIRSVEPRDREDIPAIAVQIGDRDAAVKAGWVVRDQAGNVREHRRSILKYGWMSSDNHKACDEQSPNKTALGRPGLGRLHPIFMERMGCSGIQDQAGMRGERPRFVPR